VCKTQVLLIIKRKVEGQRKTRETAECGGERSWREVRLVLGNGYQRKLKGKKKKKWAAPKNNPKNPSEGRENKSRLA